jgi:hypothetical protein
MSYVKAQTRDNGFVRDVSNGDVVAQGEVIGVLSTVGAGALTAALITGYSLISRTGPVGAYADTVATAADIIAALAVNGQTPNPGSTHRLRILNTVAFINTITANTGVTLSGTTAIAASSWRDFLVTLVNTTNASIGVGNTTNANATITGLSQTALGLITPGMTVTGTGIAGGTTVIGVNLTAGTVTLSANATATGANVALTFSPTVSIAGIGGGPV